MLTENDFLKMAKNVSAEMFFMMITYKTQLQNSLKRILTQSEINSIRLSVIDQGVTDKLVSLAKPIYDQRKDDQTLYSLAMSIGTILKEFEWGEKFISPNKLYELSKRIVL